MTEGVNYIPYVDLFWTQTMVSCVQQALKENCLLENVMCKRRFEMNKSGESSKQLRASIIRGKDKRYLVCCRYRTCTERALPRRKLWSILLASMSDCILQASARLFVLCTTCLVLSVLLNWWTLISLSDACFFKIAFSGRLNSHTNTPFDTVLQRLSESLHLPATIKSVQPPCRHSSNIKQGGFLFQYQTANSMLIRSANTGAHSHSLVLTWLKLQSILLFVLPRCLGAPTPSAGPRSTNHCVSSDSNLVPSSGSPHLKWTSKDGFTLLLPDVRDRGRQRNPAYLPFKQVGGSPVVPDHLQDWTSICCVMGGSWEPVTLPKRESQEDVETDDM